MKEDIQCERGDSNPHEKTHYHLKVARLPIPPPPREDQEEILIVLLKSIQVKLLLLYP